MMTAQLCIFALLSAAGLVLVLGGRHRSINMRELYLKERREVITKRRVSKFEKLHIRIALVIKQSGSTNRFFLFCCCGSAFAGVIAGFLLFNGALLACATGIAALPLPFLFFYLKAAKIRRSEIDQLEQSMSIITNTYASSYDIVSAVEQFNKEKNHGIPVHLRVQSPFDSFVTNATLTLNSVDRSLLILETQINNHYFSEWVKTLRMCSKDRGLVFALFPIIQAMSDAKLMQVEADTKIEVCWRDYLSTVGVMFAIVPILRFTNAEWYNILVGTPIGKFLLILMLVSALASAVFVMRAAKPDVK